MQKKELQWLCFNYSSMNDSFIPMLIPEFRTLRLTFHRKLAPKYRIKQEISLKIPNNHNGIMQKIRASKALNYFQNIYTYIRQLTFFTWNCRYSVVLTFEFQTFGIFANYVVLQKI